MKKSLVSGCLVSAAVVAGLNLRASADPTTIVHDAGMDLVGNSANRNTYTNEFGGVWEFMRAETIVPSAENPRILLDSVRRYSGSNRMAGPSVPASVNPQLPVICVCRDVENWTDAPAASGYPLHPAEMETHPGSTSGHKVSVLRFTVPRTATYAIDLSAVATANADGGAKDLIAAILVNGAVVQQKTLIHSGSATTEERTFAPAVAAREYAKGDRIEFAVHMGQELNSDNVNFTFRILEQLNAGDKVINPATALQANVALASPTDPFADPVSGRWGGYGANSTNVNFTLTRYSTLNYVRSAQGAGLKGLAMNNALPYHTVQPDNLLAWESAWTKSALLRPDEIYTHPNGGDQPTVLRYWPDEGGIYDIGIAVRDIAWTANSTGVDVFLRRDEEELAHFSVNGLNGNAGATSSDTRFIPGVELFRGRPIDFIVGPLSANDSDGTCFKLVFVKRAYKGTVYNANDAWYENMKDAMNVQPSNPTAFGGAQWEGGRYDKGFTGSFANFTGANVQNRWDGKGYAIGFNTTSSPFLGANVTEAIQPGDKFGGGSSVEVWPRAIFSHPQSDNGASAIRFIAPADGVYSAHACFQHIAGGRNGGGAEGVGIDCHILTDAASADRGYPANGFSRRNNYNASTRGFNDYLPVCSLVAGEIYLRKGDTIGFVAGSAGEYSTDSNVFDAYVVAEEGPAGRVNIDLDGYGASETPETFAGRGRIGFVDDIWNSVKVASGTAEKESRQLYRHDGTRVGTKLRVWRATGVPASAGATGDTALFRDGVCASGDTGAISYEISGLVAGETYDLYFHCRKNGRFTSNGATAETDRCWTKGTDSVGLYPDNGIKPDHAVLTVVADADGKVSGTFASADGEPSRWAGLQIAGGSFAAYEPAGMLLLFR